MVKINNLKWIEERGDWMIDYVLSHDRVGTQSGVRYIALPETAVEEDFVKYIEDEIPPADEVIVPKPWYSGVKEFFGG
jgi:nicotinamide mononucleotide adenylyltransferase